MEEKLAQVDDNAQEGIEVVSSDQQRKDLLSVVKGGGVSFIGTVAIRGLSYVYNAALIWGLGGDNFGLFTLGLVIIFFTSILTELGMDQGIIRFGAIYAENQSQVSIHKTTIVALRISLSIGLLFFILFLALANPISIAIFHKPQLAPLIRTFGVIIPILAAENLMIASTKALKIMKYSVYVSTLHQFSALIFVIPLLILRMEVQVVAISLVASYVLALCFAIYFYLKIIPRNFKDARPISTRELIKFSIPLSLTRWIQYANDRTEILFLGLLPNVINVGIYKIAWSLAGLETMLRLSLEQILAPFSSDLSYRKKVKQLENLYKTTAKWGFSAALLICLIYTLFAKPIMNIFDPAYVAGASVLIALSFAQLFNESTGACGTILIMSGRSDLSLLNTIVLLGSSIGLDWLLIPRYGLSGAAIAGAATIILVNLLRVIEVWLTLKMHPIKWSFIKPILAGLFGSALILLLRSIANPATILANLIHVLLFIVAYITFIVVMKLDAEDLVVLRALTRRIMKPKAAM